jgi:hypothetical protein
MVAERMKFEASLYFPSVDVLQALYDRFGFAAFLFQQSELNLSPTLLSKLILLSVFSQKEHHIHLEVKGST